MDMPDEHWILAISRRCKFFYKNEVVTRFEKRQEQC